MTYLISLGMIVLLLDQLTKYWVQKVFPLNTGKEVIPGFFNLVHVRNPGGAFSLFAGASQSLRQAIFIGLTSLVVAFLFYSYGKVRKEDTWTRTAYALVAFGAIGNLVDRIRFGEVVDFLDVYVGTYHWPAFNVADSAVSVGAVMLLISILRGK